MIFTLVAFIFLMLLQAKIALSLLKHKKIKYNLLHFLQLDAISFETLSV